MTAEQDFARRMRERRIRLGISQRKLAADMQTHGFDWHQTTMAKTEAGTRPLRLNEAVALAALVAMPLLADDVEPSQANQVIADLRGRLRARDPLAAALAEIADISHAALTREDR